MLAHQVCGTKYFVSSEGGVKRMSEMRAINQNHESDSEWRRMLTGEHRARMLGLLQASTLPT